MLTVHSYYKFLSLTSFRGLCCSLCKLVKHVSNPAECTSPERCVLAYLFDLYNSCEYLRVRDWLQTLSVTVV